MQMKYGSYEFNANDVFISHTRAPMRAQTGFRTGYMDRWMISFRLRGDTQAELTTEINALYSAFAVDGKDLVLVDNTGANSAFVTDSDATTSGVRITSIEFKDLVDAQYTTYIDGEIYAEAETVTNVSVDLFYSDSFSVTGNGGPKIVLLETATTVPIIQTTRQRTKVTAVQSGQARAVGALPLGPIIMFPSLLINESVNESITSSLEGGKVVYTKSWSYPFQSNQYFASTPIVRI